MKVSLITAQVEEKYLDHPDNMWNVERFKVGLKVVCFPGDVPISGEMTLQFNDSAMAEEFHKLLKSRTFLQLTSDVTAAV